MMDPRACRWENSVFHVFLVLLGVCVLLKEAKRQRLYEDGIKFSPPSPRPGGVSSIVGGLWRFVSGRSCGISVGVCLRWVHVDLVFIRLCSCVYRLDPFDIRISSSAAVAILVCCFYRAIAR